MESNVQRIFNVTENDAPGNVINAEGIAQRVQSEFPFKHTNGIIVGASRVGKSTLLNAFFSKPLVIVTGFESEKTKDIQKFETTDKTLTIYDTVGVEMERFEKTLDDVHDFIVDLNKNKDPSHHIHFIWFCIDNTRKKVLDWETNFINEFSKTIPTLIVLTQCYSTDTELVNCIRESVSSGVDIIETIASPIHLIIGDFGPLGLDVLAQKTLEKLPDGQANSLSIVTKYALESKKLKAKIAIVGAVTAATAVSATQLPFSNSIAISVIQLAMFTIISLIYGIHFDKTDLKHLVSCLVSTGMATFTGKKAVKLLLESIPGINITMAGSLTASIGIAFHDAIIEEVTLHEEPSIERVKKYMMEHSH